MSSLSRTFAVYFAARAFPSFVSFAFTVVCVQSLSPSEYGAYTLTLLPAMVVASFAGGLAGQPMLRFGAELSVPAQRRGLLTIPLISSLVLLPALIAYLFGFGRSMLSSSISLGLVPLIAMLDTRRNYFVSTSRPGSVFQLDGVRSLVALGLLTSLIAAGAARSWAPLASMLLAAAISLITIPSGNDKLPALGQRSIDGGYLRYGFWIACWMAVIGFVPLFERLLLEWQYGIRVSGLYSSIADPLASIASAAVAILVSALMPKYVATWASQGKVDTRRLTRLAIVGVIAGSIVASLAGVMIALANWGQLAKVLRSSPRLAILLVLASTVWQVGAFSHKPLELQGATRRMFSCLVVASFIFVTLAIPLGHTMGAEGVALAKVVGGVTYIFLVTHFRRPGEIAA